MHTLPLARRDLAIRDIGGESIVHDLAADRIHILNASAGWVLSACDGTRSPGEIVQALAERTGEPAGSIAPDVDACLRQFQDLGLLG